MLKGNRVLPQARAALHACRTITESITGHLVGPGNSAARSKRHGRVIYKCRRCSPASPNTVLSNEGSSTEDPSPRRLPMQGHQIQQQLAGLIVQYVNMTSTLDVNGHSNLPI